MQTIGIDVKDSVKFKRITREVLQILKFALSVWSIYDKTPTITSAHDSHDNRPKSLHNKDLALDFRIRDLTKTEIRNIIKDLRSFLSDKYDIVLESDHIHIEWDNGKKI